MTASPHSDSLTRRTVAESRKLLKIIVGGQIFDLHVFPARRRKSCAAANDESWIVTHNMVAGCVGEFGQMMSWRHLPALNEWNPEENVRTRVRFGKGCKLVKCYATFEDLRIGRCYLPVIQPSALLDHKNFETILPLYAHWPSMRRWRISTPAGSTPCEFRVLKFGCGWLVSGRFGLG